jgi:hypothetical protein
MAKYDKDQYQVLLRRLDSPKQTASVLEYHKAFEKLAHGIVLYNPAINDTFFVTRFVTGLHDDIRVPLLLHRPLDVDTTSALALIQEQELEQSRCSGREFTRGSSKNSVTSDKGKFLDISPNLSPSLSSIHVYPSLDSFQLS